MNTIESKASDTPITKPPLVGIDLDGTLAEYSEWKGIDHIGAPIVPMILTALQHIRAGHRVCIFTARVNPEHDDWQMAEGFIKEWCRSNLGRELPVTCMKSHEMVIFYDDRAIQCVPNTGLRIDGKNGDISL